MTTPILHATGSYRYLPAISAYSSGIAVEPDHAILGLSFAHAIPLAEGFRSIDRELEARGLPSQALAGVQLRSPAVMSPAVFAEFNATYLELLDVRGLLVDGSSPLSRTNVVPVSGAPDEAALHTAFVVVPSAGSSGDLVAAGSGEARGGLDPEHITAYGDTSPAGLRAKADVVIDIMLERLEALGGDGHSPTEINVYTAYDVAELADIMDTRLPAVRWRGLHAYATRPPVDHIDFEMDVHRVSQWAVVD
jgi:hypothetical protein